jgi:hypothetical protein
MVTILRSPSRVLLALVDSSLLSSSFGMNWCKRDSGAAGGEACLAPGDSAVPEDRAVPQFIQNRAPSGLAVLQFGQFIMMLPFTGLRWGPLNSDMIYMIIFLFYTMRRDHYPVQKVSIPYSPTNLHSNNLDLAFYVTLGADGFGI